MNVTEDEARSQQCPMALASETTCTCFASKCMAWRWYADLRRQVRLCEDDGATIEPPRPADLPPDWEFYPCYEDAAAWVEPEVAAQARRTGYCGMVP